MKISQVVAVILIICLRGTLMLNKETLISYGKTQNNEAAEKTLVRKTSNSLLASKFAVKANNASGEKSNTGIKDDFTMGCEIVQAYWAPPKEPKRAPYKRRWPKLPALPKKKKVYPHATCEMGEGMLFMVKLNQIFPQSSGKGNDKKKKHKKKKDKKPNASGGNSSSSSTTTTVTTKTTTTISASGTLGKFSQEIIDGATALAKRYRSDAKPKHSGAPQINREDPKKKLEKKAILGKVDKTPKKKKKRLTEEQREKIKNLKIKEAQNKESRRNCYFKIRRYLNPKFKYPYKGKKSVAIGRILKKCLAYSK